MGLRQRAKNRLFSIVVLLFSGRISAFMLNPIQAVHANSGLSLAWIAQTRKAPDVWIEDD